MAIDPSLALQVKQPDPIDFTKWQQLANLRSQNALIQQQTANAQAQNPGIQATSTTAQQTAQAAVQDQNANNHIMELAASGKYSTKDADGNTTIDYPALYGEAATKYPQQATKMAASNFDTQYKKFVAEQQEALTSGTKADVGEKWLKFSDNAVQTGANIIQKSSMPEADKPAALQKMIEAQAAHYPQAFANSPYITMTPAVDPQTGQPIPNAPPVPKLTGVITASSVKSIADGSMTPLEAAANTRADTAMNPSYINVLNRQAADVTPADTKADFARKAIAGQAYGSDLNQALTTQAQVSDILGKTVVGAKLQEAIAKGMQGPDSAVLAQYQKGIDAYNSMHPESPINLSRDGVLAANAKIQAEYNKNAGQIKGWTAGATTSSPAAMLGQPAPSGTQGPVAAPVTSTAVVPPSKATGMVRVKSPTGQMGSIPADKLDAALKAGYTKQ